jgi:hypothetical protein
MKKALKIIIGIVLIIIGIVTYIFWWPDLLAVIKGVLGLFLILAGVIMFIL